MKLVVGLGNPGKKYDGTRHNLGFRVIAELVRRNALPASRWAYQGDLFEGQVAGAKTLLLCPQTFMNLSGQSVQQAAAFYKLPLEDVLVICDDLNLPPGKIRIRASGSAGGQNGLANILQRLGSEQVPRLRLGIGRPPPNWNAVDYVLGRFTPAEEALVGPAVLTAAEATECWIREGLAVCMNKFN